MSNFFSPTNRGRIDKMQEYLGHLETSARANGATPEQWAELLAPVIAKIGELTAGAGAESVPLVRQATQTHWLNEIHMARECAIENAPKVAAVLMTRIEEHFDDLKKGAK